jgi:hypothetical protein
MRPPTNRQALERQIGAYKRLEGCFERVKNLHREAKELYGIQNDSVSLDEKVEISDDIRTVHKSLLKATKKFRAACKDFDSLLNNSRPKS